MICFEDQRLSAEQALSHEFFTSSKSRELDITDLSLNMKSKINNIKDYTQSSLLQRIIFTTMATRLSLKEMKDLEQIFNAMDVNNDGTITKQEFSEGLKMLKISEESEEVKKFFEMMDTDKSKKITYSEFITGSIDKKFFDTNEKLLEMFEVIDTNKNGVISNEEYLNFLKMEGIDEETMDDLKNEFRKADTNNDGEIEYDEFAKYVTTIRKDKFIQNQEKNKGGW